MIKKYVTGSQQDGRIYVRILFVPKKKKLGPFSGATAALWYPAVLSPGAVASHGFPGRSSPPGFPASCFLFVVLLRIRGFCDKFENSAQQQPVVHVFVVFLVL